MLEIMKKTFVARRKLLVVLYGNVFVLTVIGIAIGYSWSYKTYYNVFGLKNQTMAKILSNSVLSILDTAISDTNLHVRQNPIYIDEIIKQNKEYSKSKKEDIEKYLLKKDKQWIEGDKSIIKKYLLKETSLKLREMAQAEAVSEIFITDSYGALAAASEETTDFYQADEKWWQAAYNNGAGDVYVGDPEFDSSANIWGIVIAVPVIDNNEVIGVYKAVIDINKLFGSLSDIAIGITGRPIILDDKGNVLFYPQTQPLSTRYHIEDMLKSKNAGMIMRHPFFPEKKIFFTYSEIRHKYFLKRKLVWYAGIMQDPSEVFEPLRNLIFQMIILICIMILITIPLEIFISSLIEKIQQHKI